MGEEQGLLEDLTENHKQPRLLSLFLWEIGSLRCLVCASIPDSLLWSGSLSKDLCWKSQHRGLLISVQYSTPWETQHQQYSVQSPCSS